MGLRVSRELHLLGTLAERLDGSRKDPLLAWVADSRAGTHLTLGMLLGDSSLPGPPGPSCRPSPPGSPLASKVAFPPLPRPRPAGRSLQKPGCERSQGVYCQSAWGPTSLGSVHLPGHRLLPEDQEDGEVTANCTWPKTGTPKLRYRRPPRVGPQGPCQHAQGRGPAWPCGGKGRSSPAWPVPEHHCPSGPCPGHAPGLPCPTILRSAPPARSPGLPAPSASAGHPWGALRLRCGASALLQKVPKHGGTWSRAPGRGPGATRPQPVRGTQHPSPARPSLGAPMLGVGWGVRGPRYTPGSPRGLNCPRVDWRNASTGPETRFRCSKDAPFLCSCSQAHLAACTPST